MSSKRFWIFRSALACLALAVLSGVASARPAPSIGLVGPGVGWALLSQGTAYSPNDHLFWTSDDGGAWNDITPRDPASRQIAGVFFLDASRGWALLALKRDPPKNNQEPDNFITDISGFDLASTTDGGANWTIRHLAALPEGVGWLAASQIFFLDAAHGWMSIESPTPHWGGEGILLATIDGGNTWKPIVEVNGGGGYGPIRFTDLQNGWIAGGTDDMDLYVTRDGGSHWKEVDVPVPPGILSLFKGGRTVGQYAPPVFRDSNRGFLGVTYHEPGAEAGEDFRTLALFSTNDGGRSWRSETWVNLGEDRGVLAFTAVDSEALAPKLSDNAALTIMKLGLGGKVAETGPADVPEVPSSAALLSLQFGDTAHGWASLSDGRLLSTADGGVSWKNVTPGRKKTSMLTPSNSIISGSLSATPLQGSLVASPASAPTAAGTTITSYKSRHIGFDRCTLPSTSQMNTWWSSSPYFDYGVYAGGGNTICTSLSSSWVKTVTGYGWGLMPVWVGPQAPCTCAPSNPPGIWPNCVKFWSTTIDTSGGAYAQGQSEADAATGSRGAMGKVGLGSGSAIYYDIENYTTSATCNGNPTGSYVNSFLSGWVSEIQKNGYVAAVYGNPAPAVDWYSGSPGYGPVSPSPSDVWIAKYDNRVTIWGLNTLGDASWPTDQRMHQYVANQVVKWGPVQLQVDNDIEDADVTGGNGSKTYSFNYATLDYPGANATYPEGVNNSGQVVGYYSSHGFLYAGGSFTQMDFPNAKQTYQFAINNAGSVVGGYMDQLNVNHGLLYQSGTYTTLDYPGPTGTFASGINDDGQITGIYYDSQNNEHGFFYQAGQFTPVDYPGASQTRAAGINGDGGIAGCATTASGPVAFLWQYPAGTFSGLPVDCAGGINDNAQVIGSVGSSLVLEHEGSDTTIAPPGACPGTVSVNSVNDFSQIGQTTDKIELVGNEINPCGTGNEHGLIVTSQ